ncbi:acyltransferase family protein [Pseudomonas sp. D47]|uniref:acyltransferase family protein n=1 Tax=Pseudomonas sp. D47 TaxID=3159447 RepID=UPI00387B4616
MPYSKQLPKHLYSLDIIRGLAALIVVLWHWQHLLYVDGVTSTYRIEDQPLYSVFSIFYNYGWMAVDFFFSLSGFVFYWLYSEAVARKSVSGWTFFVARFSRLYPLHFVTFIFVLLVQFFLYADTGSYFVYQNNDVYRAIMNLFLASSWGALPGYSFNGPAWSVSVEVFLYLMFFLVCRAFSKRYMAAAACAIAGMLIKELAPELGRGVFSFFIGGLTFWIYSNVAVCVRAKTFSVIVAVFSILLWVGFAIEYEYSYFSAGLDQLLRVVVPEGYWFVIPGIIYRLSHLSVFGLLFPCSMLALALVDMWSGGLGKRFSSIGNLSYSSYLLHFPLQIVFFVIFKAFGIDRELFYSGYTMLLFFAVLVPMCLVSYNFFELPMQRIIRKKFADKRFAVPGAAI